MMLLQYQSTQSLDLVYTGRLRAYDAITVSLSTQSLDLVYTGRLRAYDAITVSINTIFMLLANTAIKVINLELKLHVGPSES